MEQAIWDYTSAAVETSPLRHTLMPIGRGALTLGVLPPGFVFS
jgi:hypothetical protein